MGDFLNQIPDACLTVGIAVILTALAAIGWAGPRRGKRGRRT